MRGHATSPARCRLSAALRTLAPGGMVTFTTVPRAPLPHAASTARRTRAWRRLRRESQGMLQQYGRRECVDVAFAPARRATHLAHRAQGGGSGVSLVHECDRKAGAPLELGRDTSSLDGAG